MGKAVQDRNWFYSFLRPIVNFGTWCHYLTFTIHGKEKLPKDFGYILAPCHQQALMEPLAVLATVDKDPVFLARADIFKQPTIHAILTFLRIMPAYRMRDGKDNLSKNAEIFDKSRDVIIDGYPFCMMAEGRHNNRHQLLPLVKGMFRIAGETQKQMGDKPLYIFPAGIDFDEYEQPYANLCINIGDPILIQPYMQDFLEAEPLALNQMRKSLTERLHQQMFDIRSTEHYDEFYTLCNILNPYQRQVARLRNNAWNRFTTRQHIANTLDQHEVENDTSFSHLMEQTKLYQAECQRVGLSEKIESGHWSFGLLLISTLTLLAILGAIIFFQPLRWILSFCLACFPIVLIPTHQITRRIIKDSQFRSSVNFAIRFLFSILYTLIFSIVMALTSGGIWGHQTDIIQRAWWGVASLLLPFLLARIAGPFICWTRSICQNWQYFTKRVFHNDSLRKLQLLRQEITQSFSKL